MNKYEQRIEAIKRVRKEECNPEPAEPTKAELEANERAVMAKLNQKVCAFGTLGLALEHCAQTLIPVGVVHVVCERIYESCDDFYDTTDLIECNSNSPSQYRALELLALAAKHCKKARIIINEVKRNIIYRLPE